MKPCEAIRFGPYHLPGINLHAILVRRDLELGGMYSWCLCP